MLLSDYIADVQEILHDSTASSWPLARVISRINDARRDAARDATGHETLALRPHFAPDLLAHGATQEIGFAEQFTRDHNLSFVAPRLGGEAVFLRELIVHSFGSTSTTTGTPACPASASTDASASSTSRADGTGRSAGNRVTDPSRRADRGVANR